jgi:hypothetical protein
MTEQNMESQTKTRGIVKSALSGLGATILYLILGVVLDYVLTQTISQYFLRECSEDCYFQLFNAIFVVVAVLSVAGGVYAAVRTHKQTSEKQ